MRHEEKPDSDIDILVDFDSTFESGWYIIELEMNVASMFYQNIRLGNVFWFLYQIWQSEWRACGAARIA